MTTDHTLTADVAGERLDVFLARRVPDLSRAHAHRLIADGHVRVVGASPKPSLRLEEGAVVRLHPPTPTPLTLAAQSIPLVVVYEDADVLVIDKPPGMPVHPGPGHGHSTVVNAVLAHCPDLTGIGDALRPGIVHRLDMDTSGLLLIAKNDAAHAHLSAQMAARSTRKQYLALVKGAPPATGTIDAPIARHPGQRKQMAVVAEGRPSRTHFRVLGQVGDQSLLLVRLETGRTHQIRVHFAAIGHPVVGDAVYGTRSDLVDRQFLHAWRLDFAHPRTGEPLSLEAPLPDDLLHALRLALVRSGTLEAGAAIAAMLT